jgi:hypothetical protein
MVELPRQEWTDLIGRLSLVCQNENPIARQSAIQTLGFICERLKEQG